MLRILLMTLMMLLTLCVSAHAQNEFPTPTPGKLVPGIVDMCLDGNGNAVPISNGTCAFPGASSSNQALIIALLQQMLNSAASPGTPLVGGASGQGNTVTGNTGAADCPP